jgi:hypothetical protein
LEIDEQCHAKTGGLQIIDALSQMFVAQPVHALQFQYDLLVDYQIGTIFAHILPLMSKSETKPEFWHSLRAA